MKRFLFFSVCLVIFNLAQGQIKWAKDGNSYYRIESGELVQYVLPANTKTTLVSKAMLTPSGAVKPLALRSYAFSADGTKMLIYTNTKRVWRYDSRGDYWMLDVTSKSLKKLGVTLPESSLMFAKFSPDASKVAYVSNYNLFVEDLASGAITALTAGGNRKNIYGTFDWVYEEEFDCRDGFQWSPDSKKISFWHVDATKIKDYYMLNLTDSTYSKIIPVEYPVVGEAPSPVRVGVVDVATKSTDWLKIPGDPAQNYLPRTEWKSNSEIFVQQLDRKQQVSKIYNCAAGGDCKMIFTETEKAWINAGAPWDLGRGLDFRHSFRWLNGGKEFLWFSEKGGWEQIYRVSADGTKESLITNTKYDVLDVKYLDEKNNLVYFTASPDNATQKYLYTMKLDGKGKAEKVTPAGFEGTHDYNLSPNGKFAVHTFTNRTTPNSMELIALPSH
ncbi:MAG: DPP IV N-terminal domain-containing protein, partial [Cyclobacteriaceae bacterium]